MARINRKGTGRAGDCGPIVLLKDMPPMTSKPSRIHLLKVLSFLTLEVNPVTHGCVWWWWDIYSKTQSRRGEGQICICNVAFVE